MVPAYARVLMGSKPYSAPEGTIVAPVELEVRKVKLSASHLQRYRQICGVPSQARMPPACCTRWQCPLHMQPSSRKISVKVLV
jgi:hypothetical protein